MIDGLAQVDELTTTQSGTSLLYTSGTFARAIATTATGTTATFSTLSGNQIAIGGSEVAAYYRMGTNTDGGLIVNYNARTALSGGDLVIASGGEVAVAGAFSTSPAAVVGVAIPAAPVASGTACPVLVHGVYQLTASAAVTAGLWVHQGSGTNAIQGLGAGSSANFGKALSTVTSGNTAIVIIGA